MAVRRPAYASTHGSRSANTCQKELYGSYRALIDNDLYRDCTVPIFDPHVDPRSPEGKHLFATFTRSVVQGGLRDNPALGPHLSPFLKATSPAEA